MRQTRKMAVEERLTLATCVSARLPGLSGRWDKGPPFIL